MRQMNILTRSPVLLVSFLGYTAATSLHFVHNGLFLDSYPNMPAWISVGGVFGTLSGILMLGVAGYLLLAAGRRRLGLGLLAIYAALGFDGLLHYGRAPFGAHTGVMNVTILLEAVSGGVLLLVVIWLAATGAGRTAQPAVAADA